MEDTAIEYVHHSFSPWRGCTQIDAGCKYCYAKRGSDRNKRILGEWGDAGTRVVASPSAWNDMRKIDRKCGRLGVKQRVLFHWADPFEDWVGPMMDHAGNKMIFCEQCDKVLWPHHKPCSCHAKFKRTAFLNDIRREYFRLIEECQNLTWLLTTKRPQNVRRMWENLSGCNIALGISVCDTGDAWRKFFSFRDVMYLAETSWVSAEPLIGELDLCAARILSRYECGNCGAVVSDRTHDSDDLCRTCAGEMTFVHESVDWIVVGGESGAHARPCNPDWIRKVVSQCKMAEVPCFVKQLGTNPTGISVVDPKGGNPVEWPEDLNVRQYPSSISTEA